MYTNHGLEQIAFAITYTLFYQILLQVSSYNLLWQYLIILTLLCFFLGPDNSFVDIYKGRETSLIIDKNAAELPVGKQVQFRACAINLIGVGPWGFPYGLKVPVW